ncbi:unnamed protein product [Schistosoma mattheei]|uniref:Uncharacterized protein n=1 Tax=Schistosoma mattheei TaxID=31246 RepID=A0A3P8EDW2_9TREM|nr:unnamed protein product [Schistosoma mattheei]
MENGKTKSSNSRSEGEVLLLTVEGCDNSKVFPSDNQHLQRCCLFTRGWKRSTLKMSHLAYLTVFCLRR